MSTKLTIIEGNSNDKDNVRTIMVKGEKGEMGDLNHNDIIDNLTSTATNKVLSAKQGKILKDLVDANKSDAEDTYATKVELNAEVTSRASADTTLQNNIDNETSARQDADTTLQSQILSLASGSPLVASSTSGMTDTTKVYVNTTDGYWYYYNGTAWVQGGVYQATSDPEVEDIRIAYDNKHYNTAGESVRSQILDIINYSFSANRHNPNNDTLGAYLNSSGEPINYATAGYSEKIYLNEGDYVYAEYSATFVNSPGIIAYKDGTIANLKTLSDYTVTTGNRNWEATMPANIDYIRVNFRQNYNWGVYVGLESWPTTFIPYKETINLNENINIPFQSIDYKPKLYNKNIMFCGDSITFGAHADIDSETNERKNFAYYIKKATGANVSLNAISGSTITNYPERNPFSVNRYQNLGENLDYILLAFGTNDSALGTTYDEYLGTINDTENTTFYGAWNVVLQYLIEHYPTTKIGIIGFWRGNYRYQYTEALKEICKKYRIPMLDFMQDLNVPLVGGTDFRSYNPNATVPYVDPTILDIRKTTFLYDTVHPNDAGYQYLAPIIQEYIERL